MLIKELDIFQELDIFNKTMQMVSTDDAKNILRIINNIVSKLTHSHIIDILLKEESRDGIMLRSFFGKDETERGIAKPYEIRNGIEDEETCVWTWVIQNNKPLWIQNILTQDKKKPMINKITRDTIEPRYLNFWKNTDSIIVIPLKFRGKIFGLYSVESPQSDTFSKKIKEFLEKLSCPIAQIITKADWGDYNLLQTNSAIAQLIGNIYNTIDNNSIDDLYKLSIQTDFITKKDAKQIAEAISNSIISTFQAHIVDILWREEGWSHDVESGDVLDVFLSSDKTNRGGAKPYQVKKNENPTSVWSYAFKKGGNLWLENLKNRDPQKPLLNKFSDIEIEFLYEKFWDESDSLITIPLIYRSRIYGVYSLEFPESGMIKEEDTTLFTKIADHLAQIIAKADYYEFTKNQRNDTIREYCSTWEKYKIEELLPQYRNGFIVRPFDPRFNDVEISLRDFFRDRGIKAHRYQYEPGKCFTVIENIMDQINRSHFGVIDITGCNQNVLIELGMVLISHKKFIIIQDKEENDEIPFDISAFQCYFYDLQPGNQLLLSEPGSEKYVKIEKVLDKFIKNLAKDLNYSIALEWTE